MLVEGYFVAKIESLGGGVCLTKGRRKESIWNAA